ncbi:MAG TPA: hypothetical protein VN821_06605 [Candidatus Udaeobacter sp.]|nr:hypothetical protein [Candidatus Udaeobacter sp.]
MSHKRIWLALAIFGALAACATGQPSAQNRGLLSWRGASGEELIAQLGEPETRTALGNGETMLQYRWTRMVTEGGYTVAMGSPAYQNGFGGPTAFTAGNASLPRRYIPSQSVQQVCIARFTLGADNRVSKVGWEGDGCNLTGQ